MPGGLVPARRALAADNPVLALRESRYCRVELACMQFSPYDGPNCMRAVLCVVDALRLDLRQRQVSTRSSGVCAGFVTDPSMLQFRRDNGVVDQATAVVQDHHSPVRQPRRGSVRAAQHRRLGS